MIIISYSLSNVIWVGIQTLHACTGTSLDSVSGI